MSIETRLTKLEAVISPDGAAIYFWAMTEGRLMTAQQIENGIAAMNAPKNARVTPVRWLAHGEDLSE